MAAIGPEKPVGSIEAKLEYDTDPELRELLGALNTVTTIVRGQTGYRESR